MITWQRIWYFLENIDLTFAVIGIITCGIAIIFNFINLKSLLIFYTFGLLFISFLTYLAFQSKFHINPDIFKSTFGVKIFGIIFFILYSLSILILYFRPNLYERPLVYFIIIILMAGVLAGECISAERQHSWFILAQIFLFGMNIGWSHLMIVPSLIGIDPWYHYGLTNEIIIGHYIPSLNQFYQNYTLQPIFHLIIAITSIITTFSYKFASILSVSMGQIVCNATFVYLFSNYYFKNQKIGLLAALLVLTASLHIAWTYWSIPNGFGGIFWIILLFLLLTKKKSFLLIIIFMSTIILTHPLIAIITAISLFLVYASFCYREFILKKNEENLSLLIPCFFTIAMLGWWVYASGKISTVAIYIRDFWVEFTPSATISSTAIIGPLEKIFPYLGFYLFNSLALIGILYMISKKSSNSSFSFGFVSLSTIGIPFFCYIISLVDMGGRFAYLSYIILSIPLALTLFFLGTCIIKSRTFYYIFTVGTIIIISFLSIMSTNACVDNHLFAPITGRTLYYTQSEMTGSDFFGTNTSGVISSDNIYSTESSSSIFVHKYGFDYSQVKNYDIDYSLNNGEFLHDNSIKIIRKSHLLEFERKGYLSPIIQPNIDQYLSKSGFNKIFDNSEMTGYSD